MKRALSKIKKRPVKSYLTNMINMPDDNNIIFFMFVTFKLRHRLLLLITLYVNKELTKIFLAFDPPPAP